MADEKRRIVLTSFQGKIVATALHGSIVSQVLPVVESSEKKDTPFLVGDVVIGVVRDVVKGMSGAFIRLKTGNEKAAFLPFSETPSPEKLKPEQWIAVQIVALPMGSKPYRVSAYITRTNEFYCLGKGKPGFHYSKKLSAEQIESLTAFHKDLWTKMKSSSTEDSSTTMQAGIIVRTEAAAHLAEPAILTEAFLSLWKEYQQLALRITTGQAFCVVAKGRSDLVEAISKEKPEELVLDVSGGLSEEETASLKENLEVQFPSIPTREYREQGMSYSSLMGISKQLSEALQDKVWLTDGGFLVIERTEAMHVIDVNVGKNDKLHGGDEEKLVLAANIVAGKEALHQIRLRHLSGIIMIDFINMEATQEQELLRVLREEAKEDTCSIRIVDITKLGICEITRKKELPPLADWWKKA